MKLSFALQKIKGGVLILECSAFKELHISDFVNNGD